jgi:predicted 2-oxoglutarate/Fe(II)-dependent dioxygenase YbiX/peroxiredoxin
VSVPFPPLEALAIGDPAPNFIAASRANPKFNFNTVAGRYVLLAFMPRDPAARAAALAALEPHQQRFDGGNIAAFFVGVDPDLPATAEDRVPAQRWFFDTDGTVSRLYGALDADGTERPHWLLLDPMLRVLDRAPIIESDAFLARLAALPPAALHAGFELVAPVAIVPRVFDLDLCRRLIECYEAKGGEVSGVMREIGGRTVGVIGPMKSRRDVTLEEHPELRKEIVGKLSRALVPEVRRVFNFEATRLERYLVACYDAREGGYFRAHRDNETKGTAHRRFAVSINLNAEDFEGGDLRFPEFGPRTYRPPTGGAVVFCCSMQHEATAVTKGRRFAFLPFLYDDEGARIRAENRAFLDEGPPLVVQS